MPCDVDVLLWVIVRRAAYRYALSYGRSMVALLTEHRFADG